MTALVQGNRTRQSSFVGREFSNAFQGPYRVLPGRIFLSERYASRQMLEVLGDGGGRPSYKKVFPDSFLLSGCTSRAFGQPNSVAVPIHTHFSIGRPAGPRFTLPSASNRFRGKGIQTVCDRGSIFDGSPNACSGRQTRPLFHRPDFAPTTLQILAHGEEYPVGVFRALLKNTLVSWFFRS